MAWAIPLGTAAVGMWAGAEEQKAQEEAAKRDREFNAIEAQYSYALQPSYTQVQQVGSQSGQMLAGGLAGAQLGMGGVAAYKGMGVGQQLKTGANIAPGAAGGQAYRQNIRNPWGTQPRGGYKSPWGTGSNVYG